MSKLFKLALEAEDKTADDNDLLIDKLLEKKKADKSPLSLTADLLRQRNAITKEVSDQLEEEKDGDSGDGDETPEGDQDESPDSDAVDGSGEGEKEGDSKDEPVEKEEGAGEVTGKKDGEEGEEGSEADSEDDLDGLVGSGLGDKPATEAYKEKPSPVKKPNHYTRLFEPIASAHGKYQLALESYGVAGGAVKETEQPVAYVKEAILESLSNLTTMANTYIDNNKAFTEKVATAIKETSERVTVFAELVSAGKHHFTHKLVSNKDVMANIAFKGNSDLRDSVRVMGQYLTTTNNAASTLLNSEFSEMKSAFLTNGFEADGEEVKYKKPVPGFVVAKIDMVPYVSYVRTKPGEYSFFLTKEIKTEDLYSLPSIGLTDDKDIAYVMNALGELVVSTGISVDTLDGITQNFVSFVDSIKVLAYDVQQDVYKNLTDLGLDSKIQDFIRFKLVMEICHSNINLATTYTTSVTTALNELLELRE